MMQNIIRIKTLIVKIVNWIVIAMIVVVVYQKATEALKEVDHYFQSFGLESSISIIWI